MAATVEQQIVAYFESKGLSHAAAAGIAGNIHQESSFNPNAPGGGLIQGQGGRTSSGTVQQQLAGVYRELTTTYQGTLINLQRAKTPREAARIFSQQFERPGVPNLPARELYAEEAAKRTTKLTGVLGTLGNIVDPTNWDPFKGTQTGKALGEAGNLPSPTGWVSQLLGGAGTLVLEGILLLAGAVLVVYGIMIAVRPRESAFSIPLGR